MPHWLEALGWFVKPPDLRSRREVDDEIAAELEFHLAERTAELEHTGLAPADARNEAERRFGDRARVLKECRQAQIGERIMLQRIQAGLLVALIGVVGWLAWQNRVSAQASAAALTAMTARLETVSHAIAARDADRRASEVDEPRRERLSPDQPALLQLAKEARSPAELAKLEEGWLRRLNRDAGWRIAIAVGDEITTLPPEAARDAITAMWPCIVSAEQRRQLLKPFAMDALHPEALAILDLAARDPDLGVQGGAFYYLRSIALRDFSVDYAAYEPWHASYGSRPITDVLVGSARDLAARLRDADGAAVEGAMAEWKLNRLAEAGVRDAIVRALRDDGMLAVAEAWAGAEDERLRDAAPAWLALLRIDVAELRRWIEADTPRRQVALATLNDPNCELRDAEFRWMLSSEDRRLAQIGTWRLSSHAVSRELFDDCIAPRLLDFASLDREAVDHFANALARPECAFAADEFERMLLECHPERGFALSAAAVLGQIGDARAIPALIAAVSAIDDRRLANQVASAGLARLTGVQASDQRDAGFWLRWWNENQERLPERARRGELPRVSWRDDR